MLILFANDIEIRYAKVEEIGEIKRLADRNRETLGFIMRPAFLESYEKYWLLVACCKDDIIGFVRFRHRRDHVTTLYEICVAKPYRGMGVGRKLIFSLDLDARIEGSTKIQLKAPTHIDANGFYEHLGFSWTYSTLQNGKRRPLNVWEYTLG